MKTYTEFKKIIDRITENPELAHSNEEYKTVSDAMFIAVSLTAREKLLFWTMLIDDETEMADNRKLAYRLYQVFDKKLIDKLSMFMQLLEFDDEVKKRVSELQRTIDRQKEEAINS